MPGGDRTGPKGVGPMTGRGVGICAGNDVPGNMNPSAGRSGRGFGHGRGGGSGRGFQGGGRGWRHQNYGTVIPREERGYGYQNPAGSSASSTPVNEQTVKADELANLKEQVRVHKSVLEDFEKQLGELQRETNAASEGQQNEEE